MRYSPTFRSMKKLLKLLFISISSFIISGCSSKNESNLSATDLAFINSIIPLEKGEEIELFETNGGFNGLKTSGNFITNQRIASYWLKEAGQINVIAYEAIDSIKTIDLVNAVAYAYYLKVYTDTTIFNIYVDADSVRTWQFFNQAIKNWETSQD